MRTGDTKTARSLHISVVRYEQQAVLLANVEEARYRVLLTKDGKSLVESRYAVRNNQRNFLKITLPSGAFLWSAALAGKPVRPGSGPDGSLLLPLEKTRTGEDAPAFAVEVVYLMPSVAWTDKGRVKLALPALDLPISRTGLQVFYPPLFRLAAEPGAFEVETYVNPSSAVLIAAIAEPPPDTPVAMPIANAEYGVVSNSPSSNKDLDESKGRDDRKGKNAKQAAQTLVDRFRASERGARASGILPVHVNFPAFGPSLFLVSVLTSENQAPSVEFSYQQEKKAGGK